MNTILPIIGCRIKVDVVGAIVNGYVTGFNKKDGRKIVEYHPGEEPPAKGLCGTQWTYLENIQDIKSASYAALELAYVTSAGALEMAQAFLGDTQFEVKAYVAARYALTEHNEFAGLLPDTHFSDGTHDPNGVDGNGSDGH